MNSDWSEWHDVYAKPDSGLDDRLAAVRAQIDRRLGATAPDPLPVISVCAGDGRDLLGVLARRSGADRVTALLVDYDVGLATRARETDKALSAQIDVRQSDAAQSDVYTGAVPADVLLICGIFGNVSDAGVRATVEGRTSALRVGGRGGLDLATATIPTSSPPFVDGSPPPASRRSPSSRRTRTSGRWPSIASPPIPVILSPAAAGYLLSVTRRGT